MPVVSARQLKTLLWVGLSAPLAWLLVRIGMELRQQNSGLGAEPSEALLHYLGEWALIMLLFAFAVSPLRRRMGWLALGRNRRLVGLFAFTYVALHVLTYVGLYAQFKLAEVVDDFVHRPYITVGIAAFLALSLMALTSTRGWRRRLQKNWQRLHWLIYAAAPLAVVHLLWLRKDSTLDAVIYLMILIGLLGERAAFFWQRHQAGQNNR